MEYLLTVYLQGSIEDHTCSYEVFNYVGSLETIHDILWQNRQLWNKNTDEYYWSVYHCGDEVEFKEDF